MLVKIAVISLSGRLSVPSADDLIVMLFVSALTMVPYLQEPSVLWKLIEVACVMCCILAMSVCARMFVVLANVKLRVKIMLLNTMVAF